MIHVPVNEFLERGKFFLINERELLNEIDKMFETRVEVGLGAHILNLLKVRIVDVTI